MIRGYHQTSAVITVIVILYPEETFIVLVMTAILENDVVMVCHRRLCVVTSLQTSSNWLSFLYYLVTDECSSNPCQNGAICIDKHLDFSCQCQSGWEGSLCEKGKYDVFLRGLGQVTQRFAAHTSITKFVGLCMKLFIQHCPGNENGWFIHHY